MDILGLRVPSALLDRYPGEMPGQDRPVVFIGPLVLRCNTTKDAELLVLRHENAVLRR